MTGAESLTDPERLCSCAWCPAWMTPAGPRPGACTRCGAEELSVVHVLEYVHPPLSGWSNDASERIASRCRRCGARGLEERPALPDTPSGRRTGPVRERRISSAAECPACGGCTAVERQPWIVCGGCGASARSLRLP